MSLNTYYTVCCHFSFTESIWGGGGDGDDKMTYDLAMSSGLHIGPEMVSLTANNW